MAGDDKIIDDYDLETKKACIRLKNTGKSTFEVAVAMKVPVKLLAGWLRNKQRIMNQTRVNKRRRPACGKPAVCPYTSAETQPIIQESGASALPLEAIPRRQSRHGAEPFPLLQEEDDDVCPLGTRTNLRSTGASRTRSFFDRPGSSTMQDEDERNYDIPDSLTNDVCPNEMTEEPFTFEYDVPYRRKVWINGRLKEIVGIVPKPKEAIYTGDIFDERFSTIKTIPTDRITIELPDPPVVEDDVEQCPLRCPTARGATKADAEQCPLRRSTRRNAQSSMVECPTTSGSTKPCKKEPKPKKTTKKGKCPKLKETEYEIMLRDMMREVEEECELSD